jgi:hypothetical protein
VRNKISSLRIMPPSFNSYISTLSVSQISILSVKKFLNFSNTLSKKIISSSEDLS